MPNSRTTGSISAGNASSVISRNLAQRHRRLDRIVPAPRDHGVHDHERDAEQQSGHHAAEEEVADRGVRHQRVDDHRNRRRNDRADDGRRRGDRAGVGDRILPVAGHHADDDAADADGVGDRRSRHAGEDDVRHHVDVPEPAAEAADEHEAELQQPVGEAAGVHQVGGEDEQRHRQQHVAVEQAVQQSARPRCPRSRPASSR